GAEMLTPLAASKSLGSLPASGQRKLARRGTLGPLFPARGRRFGGAGGVELVRRGRARGGRQPRPVGGARPRPSALAGAFRDHPATPPDVRRDVGGGPRPQGRRFLPRFRGTGPRRARRRRRSRPPPPAVRPLPGRRPPPPG